MSNKIELIEALMEIEILSEKAYVVCNDLHNAYFEKADPDPCVLQALYVDANIRTSIILSFLQDMVKLTKELLDLIEESEPAQDRRQVV